MPSFEHNFPEGQTVLASCLVDCANNKSCRLAREILLERWRYDGIISQRSISQAVKTWEAINEEVYLADPGAITSEGCETSCSIARFCLKEVEGKVMSYNMECDESSLSRTNEAKNTR